LDDKDITPFNMDGHRDTAYELPLPDDAATENHHGILAFTLHATDPDDLHIEIRVDALDHTSAPIWNYTINSNVLHTVHQEIPLGHLRAGVTNFARVHLASGGGYVRVDNMVLWFKRFDKN